MFAIFDFHSLEHGTRKLYVQRANQLLLFHLSVNRSPTGTGKTSKIRYCVTCCITTLFSFQIHPTASDFVDNLLIPKGQGLCKLVDVFD